MVLVAQRTKEAEIMEQDSLLLARNLLRIAIYNISYIRGLFPEKYFNDKSVPALEMKIKKLMPIDAESRRLIDWMEKGVYDALQKKYLKTLLFCICEKEEGPMIEEYAFTFSYPNKDTDEVEMKLSRTGSKKSSATFKSNAAEVTPDQMRSSACKMIRTLVSLMRTLEPMPEERTILMKLLYHDDTTPEDYEPPFFKCCAQNEGIDIWNKSQSQMGNINSRELVSAWANGPAADLSNGPHGYLLCTTSNSPTFYFDSGASWHVCNDRNLLDSTQEAPPESRPVLSLVDGTTVRLKTFGTLNRDGMTLSPVFFAPKFGFNVVSLGMLDDGINMIYLGDRRIRIFDMSKGTTIGEGFLHSRKNEYAVRNIRSIKGLEDCPKPEKGKPARAVSGGESQARKRRRYATEAKATSSDAPIPEQEWIIDSLAAQHITGTPEILFDTKQERQVFLTPKGQVTSSLVGNVRDPQHELDLKSVLFLKFL